MCLWLAVSPLSLFPAARVVKMLSSSVSSLVPSFVASLPGGFCSAVSFFPLGPAAFFRSPGSGCCLSFFGACRFARAAVVARSAVAAGLWAVVLPARGPAGSFLGLSVWLAPSVGCLWASAAFRSAADGGVRLSACRAAAVRRGSPAPRLVVRG